MAKFESHITFHIKDAEAVKQIGDFGGWKYSQIEGDAVMGAKPYCYLTGYEPIAKDLFNRVMAAKTFAELDGVEVLRTKIEQIIWDSKTGLDELGGYSNE